MNVMDYVAHAFYYTLIALGVMITIFVWTMILLMGGWGYLVAGIDLVLVIIIVNILLKENKNGKRK